MTSEMGSELELPKTYFKRLSAHSLEIKAHIRTHPHSRHEVRRPLPKSKSLRDPNGANIRHKRLHNKYDRNHRQLSQLIGRQLARQLREDQTRREQRHVKVRDELLRLRIEHALPGDDITRQTDADDLQHGLEDEENEVAECWVGGVRWWPIARCLEDTDGRLGEDGRMLVGAHAADELVVLQGGRRAEEGRHCEGKIVP